MLEVDMKTTIRTLYKKGYNKTQIGRMLGIDRKTVRCFLQALFPQKCRLTSSKLHGEFPHYCISSSGTLSGAGEELNITVRRVLPQLSVFNLGNLISL